MLFVALCCLCCAVSLWCVSCYVLAQCIYYVSCLCASCCLCCVTLGGGAVRGGSIALHGVACSMVRCDVLRWLQAAAAVCSSLCCMMLMLFECRVLWRAVLCVVACCRTAL